MGMTLSLSSDRTLQAGLLGNLGCTECVAVPGLHRWVCQQGYAVLLRQEPAPARWVSMRGG